MHSLIKFLYHQWIDGPGRWYPLLAVYYLTYDCSFRCLYCSDGKGRPYHALKNQPLSSVQALSLLQAIRRQCDTVVITGGEPFQHPEIASILKGLRAIAFNKVIFTTNGYELDRYMALIADSVHSLVVSVDTMDAKKADTLMGVASGTFQQIQANLEMAASLKNRRFDIVLSSVVTPANIEDLYDVYAYAHQRKFMFAACPQLVGVKAHEKLVNSPRYQEFFSYLINQKQKGHRVHGSVLYLKYMKNLAKFNCRPFTMLVLSPDGRIFYPCLEHGHLTDRLNNESNLHHVRIASQKRFGPLPECGNQCHSACALGFATALNHPRSIVEEAYLAAKAAMGKLFVH